MRYVVVLKLHSPTAGHFHIGSVDNRDDRAEMPLLSATPGRPELEVVLKHFDRVLVSVREASTHMASFREKRLAEVGAELVAAGVAETFSVFTIPFI